MMRTGLVTVVLLLLVGRLVSVADPAAPPDIAGVYAGEGRNGDGSRYNAIVVITRQRDAFRVRWIFPSRTAAVGLGILTGDVFAVSYFGTTPGIVQYRVEGERLVGQWTLIGGRGVLSTETLTRIPGDHVPQPPDGEREPTSEEEPEPSIWPV